MKHANASSTSQAASKTQDGPPHQWQRECLICMHLWKLGRPITRDNWIRANWGTEPPEDWGVETEMQLPAPLRRSMREIN